MAFTPNNDINVVQRGVNSAIGGNDLYILDLASIDNDADITISDDLGSNTIKLVGGLEITSSRIANNTLELTLSNGAVVTILEASAFTFVTGGNPLSATSGVSNDYANFVADILGGEVPDSGFNEGAAVTINDDGTGSTGGATGFTLTTSASNVRETQTLTATITADEAVTEDTVFNFSLGTTDGASAADFTSATSGTVTMASGATTVSFDVTFDATDGSEFDENFTITVTDSSGGTVGVRNVTLQDSSTEDTTAPVVTDPGASLNYDENQTEGTTIGTVAATDNVGATGFSIVSGNDDGFFAINASGEISLTAAGVASAANDFETGTNTATLGITATDAAGNTSAAQDVTLEVKDVDDVPPSLTSATISGDTATLTFNEVLNTASPSPAPSDFTVTVKGSASQVSVNQVTVNGQTVLLKLATTPAAGETFQVAYAPGVNPVEDVAGNDAGAFDATDIVLDTAAPVITAGQTFSYQEGEHDDTADVVGKVATDDPSAGVFAIESGNADGLFAIDGSGNITLTTVGLSAVAASNDFETTPNSFILGISATDGAGNKSATETVTVNVTDDVADNLDAPIIANLTPGADPAAGVVLGSNNDDTISGTVSGLAGETTLSAIDFINAGDHGPKGDTLNIELKGVNYNGGATIQNVENLKLTANTAAATFNTSGVSSFTKVINNSSTTALTVNNLQNTMLNIDVVNIPTGTSAGTYNWSSGQLTGAEMLNINLDSVGTGGTSVLTVGPAPVSVNSFGAIDISSNGSNPNAITLTTDATQTSISSITANGDQNLGLTLAADNIATSATTINAASMNGNLVLSGLGAVNHTVTGGNGSDVLLFGANFNVFDTVGGGPGGVDTLGANIAQLAAITTTNKASLVSNIDTIFVQDSLGAAATIDLSFFGSGASNVRVANQAAANVLTVNNIKTGGTVRFDGAADGAHVLNVTNATDAGTTDTIIFDLRGGAVETQFTLAGVENVNVDTSNATGAQTTVMTAAALENLTITGNQSVDFQDVGSDNNNLGTGVKTVDASGMTGAATLQVALNAAATVGAKVTGTANGDTIIGSSLNDDISGGAGADALTGSVGADKISGGLGNDNFLIQTNAAGTNHSGAAIASGGSTVNLDIYSDLNAGDTLTFGQTFETGVAVGAAAAYAAIGSTIGGADDTVNFIRGVYDSNAQTWTTSAAGSDTLVVYDANTAVAAVDHDALVLVGFVDSGASSAAAGVVTLG